MFQFQDKGIKSKIIISAKFVRYIFFKNVIVHISDQWMGWVNVIIISIFFHFEKSPKSYINVAVI